MFRKRIVDSRVVKMGFRFTIARKIGAGFGVLLFFLLIVFYITYTTLNQGTNINDEITNVNNPSIASLEELKLLTVKSKMLIFNWAYHSSRSDHPDKQKLARLYERDYPHLIKKVQGLAVNWSEKDQQKIKIVLFKLSELFKLHKDVTMLLPDWDSYEDSQNVFQAKFYMEDDGDIFIKTAEILYELDDLIANQKFQTGVVTERMKKSFSNLKWITSWLGLALFVFGVLVALYTTRSIVRPVEKLKEVLSTLSRGVFPKQKMMKLEK